MVFTLAGSTALGSVMTSVIKFGSVRHDIQWDGQSFATVSILPACPSTSSSYTVSVEEVAAVAAVEYFGSTAVEITRTVGGPWTYWTNPNDSLSFQYNRFNLPNTVNTAGVISFELSSSTAFTASARYVGLPGHRPTTGNAYFRYTVEKNAGTASQVVAFGKIDRLTDNPYKDNVEISGNEPTAATCF